MKDYQSNIQLADKIKNRKLTRKELKDIYFDLINHLKLNECTTIDNYTGEYADVIDLCFEHYDDVFNTKSLSKYQTDKVRNIMNNLKTSLEKTDIEKVRPETLKLLVNYLSPKGHDLDEDNNTIKVIYKEV